MELHGWGYPGRNISPELHHQFYVMAEMLSNPLFVDSRKWGTELQSAIAIKMGLTSAGAVRTVKRTCENFGFINSTTFNGNLQITADNVLTHRGKVMFAAIGLEKLVISEKMLSEDCKKRAMEEIKKIYEECYCDGLSEYYITNSDGSHLCPLRVAVKAILKYKKLDKWEWYMVNTFIKIDDDILAEKELDDHIARYRNGEFSLQMNDIVENPKGHQYLPQYFDYAGLLHVVQVPDWTMMNTDKHIDVKQKVISDSFLQKLYGGGH